MSELDAKKQAELDEANQYFGEDRFATQAAGATIDKVGDKYARCSLKLGDVHRNALGAVMGGVMYTLADFCFAVASNFHQGPAVTVVSQISFLGQPKGEMLFAESRLIKDGRRNCFFEVEVRDETGKACAVVSFNGARLAEGSGK